MTLNNLSDYYAKYYVCYDRNAICHSEHPYLGVNKMKFHFLPIESPGAFGSFHGSLFFKWQFRNLRSFHYVVLPLQSFTSRHAEQVNEGSHRRFSALNLELTFKELIHLVFVWTKRVALNQLRRMLRNGFILCA